jgi:hypothetical protein
MDPAGNFLQYFNIDWIISVLTANCPKADKTPTPRQLAGRRSFSQDTGRHFLFSGFSGSWERCWRR